MAKRKHARSIPLPSATSGSRPTATGDGLPPLAAGVLVFAVIAFAALVRLRLLDLPLERDEGEYAYAGQLMLHGLPPYAHVFNMKFPGTYAMYALIEAVFGQTIHGIRLGLIVVTSITTLLLYLLGTRLLGRASGVVAAAAHAVLALSLTVMGPFAHATHFVALFAVAGALMLVPKGAGFLSPGPGSQGAGSRNIPVPGTAAGPGTRHPAPSSTAIFFSGILMALATLMKQPGAAFVLFGVVWLALQPEKRIRNVGLFVAGGLTVAGLTAGLLAAAGVFRQFWFWTIEYAREYATVTPLAEGWQSLKENLTIVVHGAPLVWLLAIAGAVVLLVDPQLRRRAAFIGGFVLAGFAAVVPGLYFRPHYFIAALPGVALLCAAAVTGLERLIARRNGPLFARALPAVAFFVALLASVGSQAQWLLNAGPASFMSVANSGNPFVEAPQVGDYLREHTTPDDRIAILGSEPEIYFYANRRAATGYIYAYPLMEPQKFARQMQLELIRGIEQVKPKYLVMVTHTNSWLARKDSDRTIFGWYTKTATNGAYALEAIVDDGNWVEGAEARTYQPRTKNLILIFRRA